MYHWTITRLRSATVNKDDILHFYNMKIRFVLEHAAKVFTSMLSAENVINMMIIQKIVDRDQSYD